MGSEQRAIAVFDLDGTLTDTRHRLRFVESAPKDWNAFFRAARHDPPLAVGVRLAEKWADSCDLGYVTGRPERCRRDTVRWLAEQGLPTGELWMRGDQDRRPARVAKLQLLKELAAERMVALVVDDDEQVCEAYRRAGFRVLHADWMAAIAPVLERIQEDDGRT